VSLGGTKAIPITGNILSGFMELWDVYQADQKYQACITGH